MPLPTTVGNLFSTRVRSSILPELHLSSRYPPSSNRIVLQTSKGQLPSPSNSTCSHPHPSVHGIAELNLAPGIKLFEIVIVLVLQWEYPNTHVKHYGPKQQYWYGPKEIV